MTGKCHDGKQKQKHDSAHSAYSKTPQEILPARQPPLKAKKNVNHAITPT